MVDAVTAQPPDLGVVPTGSEEAMLDALKLEHGIALNDLPTVPVTGTHQLLLSVAGMYQTGANGDQLVGPFTVHQTTTQRGQISGPATAYFPGQVKISPTMASTLPNLYMPHPMLMSPIPVRPAMRTHDANGDHREVAPLLPSPDDSSTSTPSPPPTLGADELNDDYLYACLKDMSPVTPTLQFPAEVLGMQLENIQEDMHIVQRKVSMKAKSNRRKAKSVSDGSLYSEMSHPMSNPSSMDSLVAGLHNVDAMLGHHSLHAQSLDDFFFGVPVARSNSASILGSRIGVSGLAQRNDAGVADPSLEAKAVRHKSLPRQRKPKGAEARDARQSHLFRGPLNSMSLGDSALDAHVPVRAGRYTLASQRIVIQESLACPETVTSITLCHTRLVQKSYGTEKRFFCPPPCLVLQGPWTRDLSQISCAIALEKSDTGFPFAVDASAVEGDRVCLLAKTMFVGDGEKAKTYPLQVVFRRHGASSRILTSPIKVVSKPSQKKSSRVTQANDEMAIAPGTSIALFNRIRSQTASTKYMTGSAGGLAVSSSQWDSLTIRVANAEVSDAPKKLTYGEAVEIWSGNVLQGTFVPHPVRKLVADPQSNENVSELNRLVLIKPDSLDCLAVGENDTVTVMQSRANPEGKLLVPENAVWSIISTDKSTIRFKEPRGLTRVAFSPAPQLVSIQVMDDNQRVELRGSNLSPGFTVWFDDTPMYTEVMSTEYLVCHLNEEVRDHLTNDIYLFRRPMDGHPIRISLSRDADGVVFIMEGYQMIP